MARSKKPIDLFQALASLDEKYNQLGIHFGESGWHIAESKEYQAIKKALEEHEEEKQLLGFLKDTLKKHLEPIPIYNHDDDTFRYEIRVYPDADDDWGIIYQDATKEQYDMVARWIQ